MKQTIDKMSTNITKSTFSLTPTNFEEAMKFADIIAKSSLVPKCYQGKPGDILIATQMGAELGLKPFQSLQNIAVINGRPSVWGDALLALVKSHPEFEDHKEYFEANDTVAVCEIKRKNRSVTVSKFSIDDAKKAGLWGKPGPWSTYPKRMLPMRARGFALRDAFPDALAGLITREEAEDYKDITPPKEEKVITEIVTAEGEVISAKQIEVDTNFNITNKAGMEHPFTAEALKNYLIIMIENISNTDEFEEFEENKKRNVKELKRFKELHPEYMDEIIKLQNEKKTHLTSTKE